MKPSHTFEVPLGLCGECLEAMLDHERGRPAIHQDLGNDCSLWGVYCEHAQTGAFTVLAPGQDVQWTMITPTDVQPFIELARRAAGKYARQFEEQRQRRENS